MGLSDAAREAQDRAVHAAARDTGARPEEVELLSVEPHEWNDTSLGCPQPGHAYAQVITSGFLVRVRSRGAQRAYHVSGQRVVSCA